MNFGRARAVADAVLFEGYALYPYRATSTKNQLRWQFGVLMPRAFCEEQTGETWWSETECLVAPAKGAAAQIAGKVRFLRLRRRRVETADGQAVDSLDLGGRLLVSWDEGEVCEIDFSHLAGAADEVVACELAGDRADEIVEDATGRPAARVVRVRAPLSVRVLICSEPVAAERPCFKLRVRIENLSVCDDADPSRDRALGAAPIGTHVLLGGQGCELLSAVDPPEWAKQASAACRSVGLYPVLAGEPGCNDLMLAAPIILYDHPQVAPESPGDLFDATEIDEILTLRTLMLTDDEKRQARATDGHVQALLDRVDNIPDEVMARLHGAIRERSGPSASAACTRIGGATVAPGSKVRLRPGARRTDAQDMFLAGMTATVQAVMRDVDDQDCVAVTVDDDPAAELLKWHGRYHYFYPDEIEPLD